MTAAGNPSILNPLALKRLRHWFLALLCGIIITSSGNVFPTHAQEKQEKDPVPMAEPGRWSVLLPETQVLQSTFVAAFISADFGVTAGDHGDISYTLDGGKNWTRATNNSRCRYGLDIVSKEALWTIGDNGDVRLSTDAGQSWQAVKNIPYTNISRGISFLDQTTGWAASNKQLWATTDGAANWVELTIPTAANYLVAGISLRTETDGYLLSYKGILYTTADGAKTWTETALPLKDDEQLSPDSYPAIRFVDADNGLIVAKLKDSDVVAFKTADGGKTWNREVLPVQTETATFYLSHDALYLTITAANKVTMLAYQLKSA